VIDQVQTTLYPGGILNTGFAFNWAEERVHDALPAGPTAASRGPTSGSRRATRPVPTIRPSPRGDRPARQVRANDHYVPEVADPLSPLTFVDKIDVPVFMACQWTDEQTGGHCPTLARRMTGTDKKWFTYTNGTHVDSLSPEVLNKMVDFLEIYVAQEPPILKAPILQAGAPLIFQAVSDRRHDDAARPDPAAADSGPGQGGLRSAAADPRAVRQRRRQLERRPPVPRLRALVLELPGARHAGSLVVPGAVRRARRPARPQHRVRHVHVGRGRSPADKLHGQHRVGRRRPLDRAAGLPVETGPQRHRGVVRDLAAAHRHDRVGAAA